MQWALDDLKYFNKDSVMIFGLTIPNEILKCELQYVLGDRIFLITVHSAVLSYFYDFDYVYTFVYLF